MAHSLRSHADAMPFLWTLQRYIFKEMGKTFLLASAALTGVLGLGGGVFHMIQLGDVTPGQLIRLMGLVLPVAAALTMPIAVLFSAAATYGRLAADNEFVACRGGGINMHVLFLPTVVLSLVSAGVTFVLINFVIPGMVGSLNEFTAADVGALIRQRLDRPRGIALGRIRIRGDASAVEIIDADRVRIRDIAFAELGDEDWTRFGTAREVHLNVDRGANRVWGRLVGLSYYDRKQGRFVDGEEWVIGADQLPTALPRKLRFLNLGELLYYRKNPGRWAATREQMQRLRVGVGQSMVYADLWEDWLDDHQFSLRDETVEYIVRSERGAGPHEGGIELFEVTVEVHRPDRSDLIQAERAIVEFVRGDTLADAGLQINVYNANLSDGVAVVKLAKKKLGPVPIDPTIVARVAAISDGELLQPNPNRARLSFTSRSDVKGQEAVRFHPSTPTEPDPLAKRRREARQAWDETVRRIIATLNERLAFSISVVVLVILAAALGIVFKGSHVLTAFGISFVPSLVVIIAIVMGKQLVHNAPTYVLGLVVMWSGITLVGALDVWTLTRVLRR